MGWLPTNLTERGHIGRRTEDGGHADQVVRPPVVTIMLEGATLEEGTARTVLPHLDGSNPHSRVVTETGSTLSWVVQAQREDAAIQISARADKAGTAATEWRRLR